MNFVYIEQFVLLFQWVRYQPPLYANVTPYPPWAEGLGWMMVFSSIIWIPVTAAFLVWKEIDGTLCEVSN